MVLDGIDGCGSTTHSALLKDYLEKNGYRVHLTREPSSLDVGRLLREYLKRSEVPNPTDALLFAADRVEHYYNEILPEIENGRVVISDRYLESSIAYQAAQSEHQSSKSHRFDIDVDWIKTINKFAPLPDITVILDIEPEVSLSRKYGQDEEIDKFENEGFLKTVRRIYLERADEMNYYVIDVNRPKSDVATDIRKIIKNGL